MAWVNDLEQRQAKLRTTVHQPMIADRLLRPSTSFPAFQERSPVRRTWIPVPGLLLVTMLILAVDLLQAQPPNQESLTEEFPGLTAKERSRIAKKEVEEAAADTAYRSIMDAAEDLFRQQRYEEALKAYQQARLKRPYNVYPKVKIHDLEGMIGARNAAATEPAVEPPAPVPPVPAIPVAAVPTASPRPPVQADPVVPAKATVPPAKPGPAAVATPSPAAPIKVANTDRPPVQKEALPVPKTDGLVERTYKEGNAHVIERTVTQEGRSAVYKRVIHPWGTIYHFRDGKSIDERVWKEAFGGD